ncbi:MAG: Choline-sulfatase [uncultured Chloroflexi bacterium]|uniref:Choline-sulfatase n=1 Tax=uncultured Chloroflexota bacterium TaxID=166587 RepID=A0A6J4HXL7_9CHLR|nr:MAG: Choline-sulfatase [uncultured Chloroflexota bacterium]
MPTPNIVIVMTDQQRADFTSAAGFPLDTMPFLDSLGACGARFERAYTPMPICAPARTSMFTGRFPKAHRVRQNSAIKHALYERDLVDLLREAGYAVGLSGKNHSHLKPAELDFAVTYMHGGRTKEVDAPELSAEEAAFDDWLNELGRDRGSFSREPTPFPVECQLPYRIVRDALGWIDTLVVGPPESDPNTRTGAPVPATADARAAQQEEQRERTVGQSQPFFLWLSFPEPHNPYQVPEPYFSLFPEDQVPERIAGPEALERKTGPLGEKWRWERAMIESAYPGYDDHWRRYRANYCGMMRLVDDQLRRFVSQLEARGLWENTILLFTADHGDYAGDYGLQRKGVGLPECLARIPFIICGPRIETQPANHDDHVSLVDVLPTLCEAVGLETPYGVQGRSLWPLLTGGEYPAAEFRSGYVELGYGGLHYGEDERPELHFTYGGQRYDELNTVTQSGTVKMVRMGRWKLTYDMLGNGELYDVESDPAELTNLFEDPAHRDVRQQLVEELLRWSIRTDDDLPLANYVPKRAERGWYAR